MNEWMNEYKTKSENKRQKINIDIYSNQFLLEIIE